MKFDCDYLVIGSGFGGSVAAYRLAEKGYNVMILERGKRYNEDTLPKSNLEVTRYLWMPLLKCFGIQNISLFPGIMILTGSGVGGGSLVYANTLLEPGDDFFESPAWKGVREWKAELLPHYRTAKKMLGVATNPKMTFSDRILKDCARDLGKESTFKMAEVGVFFGEPGKEVDDPYFGGEGPKRKGCIYCGGCMVGCRYHAKNTLLKNYLYFAERLGVQILPERKAVGIAPLSEGYEVTTVRSTAWFTKDERKLRARQVILSAGVLGTVELLLRCKERLKTLPLISDRLGHDVRTNSEALVGVTEPNASSEHNYSEGVAITSIFHPDDHTHIEPVRYPKGSNFMKILSAPMASDGGPVLRPFKFLLGLILHPWLTLRLFLNKRWAETTAILLVMQTLDNRIRLKLGRHPFTFFKKRLITAPEPGAPKVPHFIPVANAVARMFAEKVGGTPQSAINEVLLSIPTTAHILGGCGIGATPETGVVGPDHQVFGYPGLYVCDGSVVPANLGVNPSLTITAMTERAMDGIK